MHHDLLKKIVEGALLASAQPLTIEQLLDLFPDGEQPERQPLREALVALAEDCENRGIELKEVASGFRYQVSSEVTPWVSRLWEERPAKYSRAVLETLALIAYRQPITRGEIEDVRGVSVSSHIIKSLLEREWVRVIGHRDVPGKPALFGTTRQFLDYFNLKNLSELPVLADIRSIENIERELDFKDEKAEITTGADDSDALATAAITMPIEPPEPSVEYELGERLDTEKISENIGAHESHNIPPESQ